MAEDKQKKKLKKAMAKFNFIYTAYNARGRKVKGHIRSENKTTAILTLKNQGFSSIKIRLRRELPFIVKFFSKNKVKSEDVTVFTRQIATMQNAGIPLVQALKVIIDSTEKPEVARLIAEIRDELEAGSSLSEALRGHSQQFDTLYCNLVEAGESSGNIDEMLKRIATYREKSESLKRKLKKAMYYPVAVLSVAAIVTIILLIKVVPTFKTMFEGFGSELPAYTKFVLDISEAIQEKGFRMLVTIFFVGWLFVRFYRANEAFRNTVQRLTLKFPVFGAIIRKAALARFARTLATTFSAGVPLPDALLLVARASGNIVYYNAIMKTREQVIVGQRIASAMDDSGVFPNMVIQMVAIGEETGSLDAMLLKVADIFEEEVDLAVDGLSTLLEPFIMVLLGAIVGGLVIAMYLPIFKMGSVF